MVEWLFLAVPRGCLWFVIEVFADHTHLLFLVLLQYGLGVERELANVLACLDLSITVWI